MYVEHFNLSKRTFTDGPGTGYFSPNEEVDAATARIRQTLLGRDLVAVVTGGPGVGKSAMIAEAVSPVENQTVVAYIDQRQTQPELLSDMLLLAFGADTGDGNEASSIHRLQKVIAEHNKAGRKATAVIDISGMTLERAKRILRLAHMASEPGCQLNVILLGPHALHKLLNAPALIHLRQRVCFRYRVRPLTAGEVDKYIRYQFKLANGDFASVFDSEASSTAFQYAGGVPRLVNTLMDSVLSAACIRGLGSIEPSFIALVAKELGWKPLDSVPQQPARAVPPQLTQKAHAREQEQPVSHSTSDISGQLDVSALLSDPAPVRQNAPLSTDLDPYPPEPEPSRAKQKSDPISAPSSSIPLMDADDTSATGMLRLEDLDARFAETIFGDDDANKAAKEVLVR